MLLSTVMSPPAVTLTFDLLTESVCPRRRYIRHQILVKLTQIIYEDVVLTLFSGSLPAVTLTFDI